MTRVVFVKFQLNRTKTGIAGVAVSRKVRRACERIAEDKAKPYAQSIAPSASGTYKRSFSVKDTTVHRLPARYPMTRGGARLVSSDPGAVAIEVGTAGYSRGRLTFTPAHGVLRRTLEHLHATSGYRRGSHRDAT